MNRRAFALTISVLTVSAIMFRSLLKRRNASEAESFRDRVLKLVRASHPDIQFKPSASSPEIIMAGKTQVGLQNLKAKFDRSDRSQETLENLVATHFDFILQDHSDAPDFETALKSLRPQIMPPEFAKQAPIITFPLGRTLAIGIVLDSEKGYLYLRREDALRWKKSEKELLEIATSNLDEASRHMEMQSSDTAEVKWIGIETKDGFDAARVLVPKLREFLGSRLGNPFHFAIPNRDFLICWDIGASARFTDFTAAKVRKDFETQPYPLSPNVFKVTADGVITEEV